MQPSNGDAFRRRVAGMGIAEVICSPASPWQNPYAERVIGSIRRECLDHVIVFGEAHLRRLIFAYVAYYHRSRTHLGLGKDTPDGRPSNRQAPDGSSRFPKSVVSITDTSVARRKRHVPSLTVESTPCFAGVLAARAAPWRPSAFLKSTDSTGRAQRRPFHILQSVRVRTRLRPIAFWPMIGRTCCVKNLLQT